MLEKIRKIPYVALFLLTNNSIAESIRPTDTVGRDLDYPPPFRWAGHIGIATAERSWQEAHYVIEVLKDPYQVIQINNLDDFKKRSKYWGAKFGINKNDFSGT